jgi:hypothetical protein
MSYSQWKAVIELLIAIINLIATWINGPDGN